MMNTIETNIGKKSLLFLLFYSFFSFVSLKAEIPIGYYYLAQNKSGEELKTALHQIITKCKTLSYGGGEENTIWCGFYETDRNSVDNSVIDRYSSEKYYFDSRCMSVSGMHIEHSLPKSWWGDLTNNAYCDLHHLFPADGQANLMKNNLPLGKVSTATFDNGISKVGDNTFGEIYRGKCFEPADEYKGDFARAYFYVSTAYENLAARWDSPMMEKNTYPVWEPWALQMLLEWHRSDPVSGLEQARMEKVFAFQGNRNPYIDYPNLVEHVWGNDSKEDFTFPAETGAFLLTPNRWTVADLGVVINNAVGHTELDFEGVNLVGDIELRFLQDNQGFSASILQPKKQGDHTFATIEIRFCGIGSGLHLDTLSLSGGGLKSAVLIPVTVVVSTEFVVLDPSPVTATTAVLNWMEYPDAENYVVDVFQGDTRSGDLLFSTYIEGDAWNKAIEIYNGTGQDIDLSKYSLRKQSNGFGSFAFNYPLSGIIRVDSTLVIVHGSATNSELLAKADRTTTTYYEDIMSFNGNDAMALYREGILIDMIGIKDSQDAWGENVCLKRKSKVTQPNVNFDFEEWMTTSYENYSLLKTHQVDFCLNSDYILHEKSVGNTTSYQVKNLNPLSKYSYQVAVCKNGDCQMSKNTKALRTLPLLAPLALEATSVMDNSFVANWNYEVDATRYLFSVFRLEGAGTIDVQEGFDIIESDGKPLPASWTGTISGNYSTATNSGTTVPSAAFKNNGEYLQTPTYVLPITALSFMAKFVSGGTGSHLIVEALNGSLVTPIDTLQFEHNNKQTFDYTFSAEQDVYAIRFLYNKVKGNLALDDVKITYGQLDTMFVLKNEEVAEEHFLVSNLLPQTDYFYFLRILSGTSLSDFSNVIKVCTSAEHLSGIDQEINLNDSHPLVYNSLFNTICVERASSPIVVFDLLGNVVARSCATSVSLKMPCCGVYIVFVNSKSYKVHVN